jgi:hypothetical protein
MRSRRWTSRATNTRPDSNVEAASWQALFNPLVYDIIAGKLVRVHVHPPCLAQQCDACLTMQVFVTPTDEARGAIALVYAAEVTCYYSLRDLANDLSLSGAQPASCCILHVVRCTCACYMLSLACCMLHVVCCMLHAACCLLHAECCSCKVYVAPRRAGFVGILLVNARNATSTLSDPSAQPDMRAQARLEGMCARRKRGCTRSRE